MSLVGRPAPDFALEGYVAGQFTEVKLSELQGKWVMLLFYPLDFTFVCPTEVLAFSDDAAQFRTLNCEVFGVSVDSKFTHKAWVETPRGEGGLGGTLNLALLSDLTRQASRDFGVLLEDDGVALRGLFLIDPHGVVVHETTNFLPVGRSSKEALRVLKAFQFVAEHGDQVCPANWNEGDDAMVATSEGMASFLATH